MSFVARYPGTCEACGGGIREGQEVAYTADGLEHINCPPPQPQCPECFTQKAVDGSCLCG